MIGDTCSADWLCEQLQQQHRVGPDDDDPSPTGNGVLLLDCRTADEYNECHVTGSLPVAVPSIMMRRVRNGTVPVCTLVGGGERGRTMFSERCKTDRIVLYDTGSSAHYDVSKCGADSVVAVLMSRLKADGCTVNYLQGGFEAFRQQYGDLCVSKRDEENAASHAHHLPDVSSTLSLSSLRLSSSAPTSSSFLDVHTPYRLSTPHHVPDVPPNKHGVGGLPFPVEVLPNLFLGNADNSRDLECLRRNNIRYVLNVTDDIANAFDDDPTLTYMRIPITDNQSETLTSFFTKAIDFIDDARSKQQGVLVHCLAGISRSVTVTVAYLMFTLAVSMDDAYDFLRRSRPNISPNFNFMGQLKDFELTLQHARQHCTCHQQQPGDGPAPDHRTARSICQRCSLQVKTYFSSPTAVAMGDELGMMTSSSSSSPFSLSSLTSSSSAQSLTSPGDCVGK